MIKWGYNNKELYPVVCLSSWKEEETPGTWRQTVICHPRRWILCTPSWVSKTMSKCAYMVFALKTKASSYGSSSRLINTVFLLPPQSVSLKRVKDTFMRLPCGHKIVRRTSHYSLTHNKIIVSSFYNSAVNWHLFFTNLLVRIKDYD